MNQVRNLDKQRNRTNISLLHKSLNVKASVLVEIILLTTEIVCY